MLVVIGLFICLLPTIFPKIDPNSSNDLGGATGVGKFLWPMCFMLGFVSILHLTGFQLALLLPKALRYFGCKALNNDASLSRSIISLSQLLV